MITAKANSKLAFVKRNVNIINSREVKTQAYKSIVQLWNILCALHCIIMFVFVY